MERLCARLLLLLSLLLAMPVVAAVAGKPAASEVSDTLRS